MRIIPLTLACALALTNTGCLILDFDVQQQDKGYNRGTMSVFYEGVTKLKITTVSGDCTIKVTSGTEVQAELEFDVRPARAMHPVLRKSGNTLIVQEKWERDGAGRVKWTLSVPKSTSVEFSTVSGNFAVEGLNGNVTASTISGNVSVSRISGDVDVKTASGNIKVRDCTGRVKTSSASGRIGDS